MNKKQRMKDYDCKLRKLKISGVQREKQRKRGSGLLKNRGGRKRRHENERSKSAELKRRKENGTMKKENGKKRKKIERGRRRKLRSTARGRSKKKSSRGHSFMASTLANTKQNSCRGLRCLTARIPRETQDEIRSKNSSDS